MSNIFGLHGGTVVAMKGRQCVCIATDLRMADGQMRNMAVNVPKVHKVADGIYVGLTGFSCDTATMLDKIRAERTVYEMREQRRMTPKVLTTLVSNMLYKKRFGPYFLNPVIAGLDPVTKESYIASSDLIGSMTIPEDFTAAGTGEEYCLAVCEAFWREDLSVDELTEATAQALLSAVERDASSGWGAIVYTITPDGVTERKLKCRMD